MFVGGVKRELSKEEKLEGKEREREIKENSAKEREGWRGRGGRGRRHWWYLQKFRQDIPLVQKLNIVYTIQKWGRGSRFPAPFLCENTG